MKNLKQKINNLHRETKIIIVTVVFTFLLNYFRGIVEYIGNSSDKEFLQVFKFFNGFENCIELVMNSGMATVIVSVFMTILSLISEKRGIPLTPAVIILMSLSITILWYVVEPLILPSVGSFLLTTAITIIAIIAYCCIVENSGKKAMNSDNNISGNKELYI